MLFYLIFGCFNDSDLLVGFEKTLRFYVAEELCQILCVGSWVCYVM